MSHTFQILIPLFLLLGTVPMRAQFDVDNESEYGNSFLSALQRVANGQPVKISAGEITFGATVVGSVSELVPQGDTIRLLFDNGEELATFYVWTVNRAIIGFQMKRYTDLGNVLDGQALRSVEALIRGETDLDTLGNPVSVMVYEVFGERQGWMRFRFREGFGEEATTPWTLRVQTNMMPKRDGTPREIDWIFQSEHYE